MLALAWFESGVLCWRRLPQFRKLLNPAHLHVQRIGEQSVLGGHVQKLMSFPFFGDGSEGQKKEEQEKEKHGTREEEEKSNRKGAEKEKISNVGGLPSFWGVYRNEEEEKEISEVKEQSSVGGGPFSLFGESKKDEEKDTSFGGRGRNVILQLSFYL